MHPGGAAFATASSDSRVRLWDLSTRTCVQTLGEHTDQVGACCLCLLLAFDACACLWQLFIRVCVLGAGLW